jgi:hypothetical protein
VSAIADDKGETARGSAPTGAQVPVTGKQAREASGAVTVGADDGAPDTAVRSEEKAEVEADVGRGRASGAAGKSKRAGTGTAARHIHDQVKKGNIKIQGATDADIHK